MIQDNKFPQPFDKCFLKVGDGHEIYVEQLGNPKGIPFIFLHGGPGSGCQNSHRSLFNLDTCRVILFDQRGAGKSLPKRLLYKNTTQTLMTDMEFIRNKFKEIPSNYIENYWAFITRSIFKT